MFFFRTLIDTVLPSRCAFTGNIVDSQGVISAEAWGSLSFISVPYCHNCGLPFDFKPLADVSGPGSVTASGTEGADLLSGAAAAAATATGPCCASCLVDPPEFSRARAALAYDDASRGFVLGFKHGDRTEYLVTMLPWLKMAGADLWADTDLVMPVPLHRWRLWRRRYNQAALMGRAVARQTDKPFMVDGLVRTRATPVQGHLSPDERRKNVKSAFAVRPERVEAVRGKTVLLVDDVYTTGSTVRECARVLRGAGAKDVFVLTLARVVRAARIS